MVQGKVSQTEVWIMKKIVGNGRWRLAIGIVAIGVLAFGLSVYGLAPPAATDAPAVTPATASAGAAAKTATAEARRSASLPRLELAATAGTGTSASSVSESGVSESDVSESEAAPIRGDRGGLRGGQRDRVIWDNYPDGASGALSSQWFTSHDFQSQNADDFIFEDASYHVRLVQWQGHYWNPAGATPNTIAFHIYIYPDDGDVPCLPPADPSPESGPTDGCALVHYTIPIGDVTVTDLGDDDYEYEATLPAEFDATEDVKYWIAIQSESAFPPQWGIAVSATIQEHKPWYGFPYLEDPFWTVQDSGDTAFRLTGIEIYDGICGDGETDPPYEECDPGDPDAEPPVPPDDELCPGECTEDCTCPPRGACCDDDPHYTGVECPDGDECEAGEECCVFLETPLCKTGPVCYEALTEKRCAEDHEGRWAGEDEAGEPIPCDSMVPNCQVCDQGMLGPCGACCHESTDNCFRNYGESTCHSSTYPSYEYTFHPGLVCNCDLPLSPPRCEEAPCEGACCDDVGGCFVESKADCEARPGDFFHEGDCVATGPPPDPPVDYCECRECDPDYTMLEGEPECSDGYVDTFNSGCNAEEAPFPFSPIACGAKVCGTNGTHLENVTLEGTGWGPLRRETDWYRLELDEPMRITWAASGGYPVHVMIIDAGDESCDEGSYTILGGAIADEACLDSSLTMDLTAGVYYLFVASPWLSATELLPVECGSIYNAELTCRSLDWLCTDLDLTVQIDEPYIEGGYSGVIALTGRTDVLREAPPYEAGQVIETEMIELDLAGSHAVLGTVTITEREDMVSAGQIEVTTVDTYGKLTGGVSDFGVYHRIIVNLEEPAGPVILYTQTAEGDPLPVPVRSTIEALPPIGAIYVLTPADPVELWANICTGGRGGEGSRADEYIYDDGSTENMIGFGGETEAVWMHHFVREADQELLTGISTAFGSLAFPGYTGLEVGDPFRVYLWSDPDLDGDPSDAVFIQEWSDTIDAGIIDTDLLQTVTIDPPVILPLSFFIGASALNEADGVYLMPMDESDPLYDDESWFDTGGPPYDPTAPTFTHAIDAGYQTNWLLRADAADGDCEELVVGWIIDVWHKVQRTIELDCSASDFPPEGEPTCYEGYDDTYNGGCNSCPPVFQTITCDPPENAFCGEAGTFLGPLCCETDADCPTGETCDAAGYCTGGPYEVRDTDWYELVLTADRTLITWTVTAEFDVDLWIIDGTAGCADRVTLAAVSGTAEAPCTPVVATADVCSPGTYWLLVAPSEFTGVPCGTESEYEAEVTCEFLPNPVCGNGIRECDEECDPGDPPDIPPDDTDCPGDCYPVGDPRACTCKVYRACCVGGTCVQGPDGDYTEEECVVGLGGIWHPNASCVGADDLPEPICDQADCCHDNGLPLDDYGCPASQYAPDLPFAAGAADDFILKSTGDSPCQITKVTTWTVHWDGQTDGHPVPADYLGINVTVYANMEPQGQPGGEPKEDPADGTHVPYFEGGVVYTGFFDAFTAFDEAPTCLDNLWRIEIDIDDEDFLLQRNVKYWLEIQPVLNLADVVSPPSYGGRVAIAFSQNSHWDNAQRIYAFYEIPWTEVDGNDGECENPPEGTRRDLAFEIEGVALVTPSAVRSCHQHGAYYGCQDLTTVNIEPRASLASMFQTLEVDFSEDLTGDTVGAALECWDADGPVTYTGTMTVDSPDGIMVKVHFDAPPLPDETCCRVTFSGDASGSVEVRSLAGDLNTSNLVEIGDRDAVKNAIGQAIDASNFTKDQNANGIIEVGDMDSILNKIGHVAPDCP